jgi:hypothetical protein
MSRSARPSRDIITITVRERFSDTGMVLGWTIQEMTPRHQPGVPPKRAFGLLGPSKGQARQRRSQSWAKEMPPHPVLGAPYLLLKEKAFLNVSTFMHYICNAFVVLTKFT